MSVAMLRYPLSPYEGEPASNIEHSSQHTYTSTTLGGTTYFNASPYFPLFPAIPLEHCEPLSALIRLFEQSRNNPETFQSFFLDLQEDMPVMSRAALRNVLKDKITLDLSQCQIMEHWMKLYNHPFTGNRAAIAELRNAVLVVLDVEMFEHDRSILTELGISILDPWKLPGNDANTPPSPWDALKVIKNHHVRIKPTAHLVNGDLCAGHPDNFLFGNTSFVSIAQGKELLRNSFTHYDTQGNLRPVIFIEHAVDNDLQAIKHSFGLDLSALNVIVTTIDTQNLASEYGFGSKLYPIGLGKLMQKYSISEPFLHNAGNDAVCTLIAALVVPSRQPPSPMASEYAALKTQQNQSHVIGTPRFCLKCESEFHTKGRCKNPIPRCEHCAGRVADAHTHKTERCVQHAKQIGLAKKKEEEDSLLPFPCQHCIEGLDGMKHKDSAARRHKT
jgi:hypothetical protein